MMIDTPISTNREVSKRRMMNSSLRIGFQNGDDPLDWIYDYDKQGAENTVPLLAWVLFYFAGVNS